MQFSTLFLAAAAASFASAVEITNTAFGVIAGQKFPITWTGAEGPVTLLLKTGPSTDLQTVMIIGSGLTGGSFDWTPSSSLDTNLYAIEIQDSTGVPNYSEQFQIAGATAAASAAVSTAAASSTTASSASASGSSTTESSTSESSSSTASSAASSSAAFSNSTTSTTTASSTNSASKTTTLTSTSKTASSSSSGSTSSSTSAPTSAAAEFASPLAFVFLAFAAIITLN